MPPKTSAYIKSYDSETKWMYFLAEDDELLGKYNSIWEEVSNTIEKEFYREPVYNKTFLKIESFGDESTDFYDQEMPKAGSSYICLAAILIDFTLKKYENYNPQVFL